MNDNTRQQFVRWFKHATGKEPYPFQIRFACEPILPELVDVPTGLGKTAMAVLGWLWRTWFCPDKLVVSMRDDRGIEGWTGGAQQCLTSISYLRI